MPLDTLKVGTAFIEVEAVAEPEVTLTFKGYAPVLQVRIIKSGLVKHLYIGAKSLATPLENLRANNDNKFKGLRFQLCKESEAQESKYIVKGL